MRTREPFDVREDLPFEEFCYLNARSFDRYPTRRARFVIQRRSTAFEGRARRIALAMQRRRDLVHEAREFVRFADEEHTGDIYVPGPMFDAVRSALNGDPLALTRFRL
jgi:hypothetical protein